MDGGSSPDCGETHREGLKQGGVGPSSCFMKKPPTCGRASGAGTQRSWVLELDGYSLAQASCDPWEADTQTCSDVQRFTGGENRRGRGAFSGHHRPMEKGLQERETLASPGGGDTSCERLLGTKGGPEEPWTSVWRVLRREGESEERR